MTDSMKTFIGLAGTATSITLSELSHIAAIAAGFTTAIWMFFQIAHRLKQMWEKRRDNSESGE